MDSYCPLLTGRREVFKTTAKFFTTAPRVSLGLMIIKRHTAKSQCKIQTGGTGNFPSFTSGGGVWRWRRRPTAGLLCGR